MNIINEYYKKDCGKRFKRLNIILFNKYIINIYFILVFYRLNTKLLIFSALVVI